MIFDKMLNRFLKKYKNRKFYKMFREKNSHNLMYPVGIFSLHGIDIGKMTYGPLKVERWNVEEEALSIGNYVSIARNVTFILGGNHSFNHFSTYPFKNRVLNDWSVTESYSKGKINVGDDVWIGLNAVILSGVEIGQGAIIGAHAVVAKNVPPYAIVAGNPAKIIGYRFGDETINKLLEFDFSNLNKEYIKGNIDYFYKKVDESVLHRLVDFQSKKYSN
ncbi:CatB-related O-acetyltransferase [Virgibacillus doumboii]|uniref:CatB-related O-acetyltransferase n=1 Tax=Virgibacillus doumboii TaxID=2697503 RepID=UPI0013DF51B4|nr:CatB-related O-acetyltransferase [Virgibacillus doumboii]